MDILLKERLVSYYEKHILEDVMPFWDRRDVYKRQVPFLTLTSLERLVAKRNSPSQKPYF